MTITAAAALSLTLALPLAACGGGNPDGSATAAGPEAAQVSRTEHNDADVAFATQMIQHHAQALSMVDLTLDRPLSQRVRSIADDILATQALEIETMSDWLQEWGEEVPSTVRDHAHAGHGAGSGGETTDTGEGAVPGMVSAKDMTALEDVSDAEFQDLWLQMMIEHHEGAVEMAEAEQEAGRFRAAVRLAEKVVGSQTQQIATMEASLS